MRGLATTLLTALLATAGCSAAPQGELEAGARATYSVAHVLGVNDDGRITGEGGAFVFHEDGYLVSRYHAFGDADALTVLLPNRAEMDGTIVAYDELSDLAVIKVDTLDPLAALSLVEQPSYEIGDPVIGLGVRKWQRTEIISGRIAAEDGRSLGIAEYEPFIIVDPDGDDDIGFGGGPLLDQFGAVVGIIASARASLPLDPGQARRLYALPSRETAAIVGRLLAGEVPLWTAMPFEGGKLPPNRARQLGAPYDDVILVRQPLAPHGSALEPNDYIVEIDGAPVNRSDDWYRALLTAPGGATFRFKIVRGAAAWRDIANAEELDEVDVSIEIPENAAGSMARPCPACDELITPRIDARPAAGARAATSESPAPAAVVAAARAVAQVSSVDPLGRREAVGSAFCFREDGYFVTAWHVVYGLDEVRLKIPGHQELRAEVVARDRVSDLAVLKAVAPAPLASIPLVDLTEAGRGERVWAAGIIEEDRLELTEGHVFGLSIRNLSVVTDHEDFVLADNDIRQGFSGGPLLNSNGQPVGIVVASKGSVISDPEQVSRTFALRAGTAAAIIGRYLLDEAPIWTDIGISDGGRGSNATFIRDGDSAQPGVRSGYDENGVFVAQDPASRFGFQARDRVRAINGVPVDTTEAWLWQALTAPAGATLEVLVRRGFEHLGEEVLELVLEIEISERDAGSITRPCPRCDEVLRNPSSRESRD